MFCEIYLNLFFTDKKIWCGLSFISYINCGSFFVSCNMKLNLDFLLETLWEYLSLIRVYTKKPGQPPDFVQGLILRKGVTVEHVCHAIHRTLAQQFKYALVWVSNEHSCAMTCTDMYALHFRYYFSWLETVTDITCELCVLLRAQVLNIHLKE